MLDPFLGSGQVAVISKMLGRQYLGFETVKEYYKDPFNSKTNPPIFIASSSAKDLDWEKKYPNKRTSKPN